MTGADAFEWRKSCLSLPAVLLLVAECYALVVGSAKFLSRITLLVLL